ncbi:MAG: hypothetical protein GY929_09525 [Actinomycetia bacterium]|nr:hypothetical protein [Actinomycetes bacterium]
MAKVLLGALVLISACSAIPDGVDADSTTPTSSTSSTTTATVLVLPPHPTTPDPPSAVGDAPPPGWTPLGEPGVGGLMTALSFHPTDPEMILIAGDLFGVGLTREAGQSWESTTGFRSWEMGRFTWHPTDPDVVWVGSMGGPYVSGDRGATWSEARVGLPDLETQEYSAPVELVLFDPNGPNRLLAFGGSQRQWVSPGSPEWGVVWESVDGGQSWTRRGEVAGGVNVQSAAFAGGSSEVVVAAALDEGIWRSTDGGRSWASASTGLPHGNVLDVAADPTDPDRFWAALGAGPVSGENHVAGGIWRSDDGGETWTPPPDDLIRFEWTDPFLTSRYHTVVVSPSDPDRLYTADLSFRENRIYRSDDGGDSWTVVADPSLPRSGAYESGELGRELTVHPQNPDLVAFAQSNYAMASDDGGQTWVDLTTARTESGSFVGRGFVGLVATDVEFNPEREGELVLAGFDAANFIQTVDGGASWRRTLVDDNDFGGANEVRFSGSEGSTIHLLLGQFNDYRGVGRSDDGGSTWTVAVGAGAGLPERGEPVESSGLAVHPQRPNVVWAVIGGRLLVSPDRGDTFSPVLDESSWHDVEVDPVDPDRVWVSGASGVLVSVDGGNTFDPIEGSPLGATRLTVDPLVPDNVYVTTFRRDGGGIHRLTGDEWSLVLADPFAHELIVDPTDGNRLVAVTSDLPFRDLDQASGVLVSVDGGQSWTPVNDGLPVERVATAAFDPHQPDRLVIGTYGRGFYQASFEALLASVGPG